MARTARRYYGYIPDQARILAPSDMNEAEVIVWAAGRGATNVVREDGPASKPTGIEFVWKANDSQAAFNLNAGLWTLLADRLPNMTVREMAPLVSEIEALVKEAQA